MKTLFITFLLVLSLQFNCFGGFVEDNFSANCKCECIEKDKYTDIYYYGLILDCVTERVSIQYNNGFMKIEDYSFILSTIYFTTEMLRDYIKNDFKSDELFLTLQDNLSILLRMVNEMRIGVWA